MIEQTTGSHLIITVHGIQTYGQWQERLEHLVTAEPIEGQIEFVNYKLGYFSLIAFMIPLFRWLVVRRFRKDLVKLCTHTRRRRIDLVAHSFGTHIVGWAIARLPKDTDIRINTVILAGSVLRAGFPWRDLIGTRVVRVINDCGVRDKVLLLSQFLVLFTGMAGRTGFSGATSRVFRNRYSAFGHSGYFRNLHGKSDDHYMKTHWLSLLRTEMPIPIFDYRTPRWSDPVLGTLANNAEPIKLAVYALPFVLAFLFYFNLYDKAEKALAVAKEERTRAEQNERTAVEQRIRAERALSAATSAADSLVLEIALEPGLRAGVPIHVVRNILDKARALQRRLVESGENTSDLRLSEALAMVGQSMTDSQGEIARRITIAEQAAAIVERLVKEEPRNSRFTWHLSNFYEYLAHAYSEDGRSEAALEIHQRVLAQRKQWAQENKGDVSYQLPLYTSLRNVSNALRNLGRLQEAFEALLDGELILTRIIDLEPDKTDAGLVYEHLANCKYHIGLIMKDWRRVDDAEKYLRSSIAIREALTKLKPSDTAHQVDLRASLVALAGILPAPRSKEALGLYQRALAIAKTLANADQGNVDRQLDVATNHTSIGDTLADLHRWHEAAAEYRAAAAIRERSVNPKDWRGRRELSMTYVRIGIVLEEAGQRVEALASFQNAVAINLELVKADPANNEFQQNLAASYSNLGATLLAMFRYRDALEAFLASISVSAKLSGADNPNWSNVADVRLSQMLDLARRTIALNRLSVNHISALRQIVQRLERYRSRCRVVSGSWRCSVP